MEKSDGAKNVCGNIETVAAGKEYRIDQSVKSRTKANERSLGENEALRRKTT